MHGSVSITLPVSRSRSRVEKKAAEAGDGHGKETLRTLRWQHALKRSSPDAVNLGEAKLVPERRLKILYHNQYEMQVV